jgi:hypothetical protein
MTEKKHAAMTSATHAKQEANQATHQMKQDAVKTANTAKETIININLCAKKARFKSRFFYYYLYLGDVFPKFRIINCAPYIVFITLIIALFLCNT